MGSGVLGMLIGLALTIYSGLQIERIRKALYPDALKPWRVGFVTIVDYIDLMRDYAVRTGDVSKLRAIVIAAVAGMVLFVGGGLLVVTAVGP